MAIKLPCSLISFSYESPTRNHPSHRYKHACWWTKVYAWGVRELIIKYRAGQESKSADALSCSPRDPPPQCGIRQDEFQVVFVRSDEDLSATLEADPVQMSKEATDYAAEQRKDDELFGFLSEGCLPGDSKRAKIVYYVYSKGGHRQRVAVRRHLQKQLMEENHRGLYGGHFTGPKLYSTLAKQWWWRGMYTDVLAYCKKCPECAVITGAGCQHQPPILLIPVQRPFQIAGVDIMDLPCTESGNKHLTVFQDMFTTL